VPAELEPLLKVKRSLTDADSRFLRERGGRFVLGYTGEIAVSEDHFIVAARVTQSPCWPWSPTLAACTADRSRATSTGHIMCY
jgi:hypothetical protein